MESMFWKVDGVQSIRACSLNSLLNKDWMVLMASMFFENICDPRPVIATDWRIYLRYRLFLPLCPIFLVLIDVPCLWLDDSLWSNIHWGQILLTNDTLEAQHYFFRAVPGQSPRLGLMSLYYSDVLFTLPWICVRYDQLIELIVLTVLKTCNWCSGSIVVFNSTNLSKVRTV